MSTFVIGLDFGGGGGRCLLLDIHSGATVSASRDWRFETAPGSGGLGFDVDLELSWSSLCETVREAMKRAGAEPGQIVGIAATALRIGNVMLDAKGESILAVPNRDARAVGPGLMLAAQHGEALYRSTGRWPYPIYAAARLQWLQAERPDDFERITDVLSISDWIAFKLCGERASDPTQASETLLFDLEQRAWSDAWIDELGLPRSIFPELREPGSKLGELEPAAADALGLRVGTPIAVGAGDTQCGLLGAGALSPGDVVAVAGTTGPIQLVLDRPLVDPELRVWGGVHLLPNRWVLESNCGPLGETLHWFARLLFPEAPQPVVRLLAEAASSVPGACGLLSSLGAEVMNARAMGLPIGQLTLTHLSSIDDASPRRHLVRSVVEGMACAMRANLEQLKRVSGMDTVSMRLTGGLSQSDTFTGIVSGVLAAPVRVTEIPGASALGAALCASVGAGLFADLETAASSLVKLRPEQRPDEAAAADYASVYQRWSSLRAARAEADTEAANLSMPFAIGAQQTTSREATQGIRPRILVAADFDAESVEALRALGDVEYASFREKKRMLTGPALVEALQGFQVFITEIDLVDAASLEKLPELRVVGTCRGDAVNVDITACSEFGIPVLNAPGRNADSVADLALGFFIMLARKFPEAGSFLAEPGIAPGDMGAMGRAFGQLQGAELWHKTIGLIGLGAVGRKVAQRLRGFGSRLIVSDPFISAEQAALVDAEVVPLEVLLEQSDFISLHAAVTPETTGMLGAAELARMKTSAFVINTARAALVDEDALISALRDGVIAGAALDTFSVEPPGSDHPFMAMANVISTPHVGGNTTDVAAHQGEIMTGELKRLIEGERPLHCLNADSLEFFDWTGERPTPSAERLEELRQGPAPAVTDLQKKKKVRQKETQGAVPATVAEASEPKAEARPSAAAAVSEVPPEIKSKLTAILEGFVYGIVGDPAIAEFAEDKDVTLHFTLTDADLAFYFHLGSGASLSGALGDPAEMADVNLRLRAGVFDGMFAGTANPMEAAMDGRLSFIGDAAKAMTLQHMQSDLERLYRAARKEVGDPGDLSTLPDPTGAAPSAASTAAAPARDDALREAIVGTVRELYEAQVITATGGNVSARADDLEKLWITPSRLFKGDLAPEVMVPIDLTGQPQAVGARSPSSEWDLHCALYRRRPEVRAVIHAHAPHATTLANTGLPFVPISTEAAFFGDIPRVPFIMPGTRELAEAVSDAMGDGWAVLMINHGLIVAGRSLRSAADMVEIIERTSELILGCHAVGKEPPTLPDDVIETLRKMGDLVA